MKMRLRDESRRRRRRYLVTRFELSEHGEGLRLIYTILGILRQAFGISLQVDKED